MESSGNVAGARHDGAVYDLIIVGGNAGGLSAAIAFQQAGLGRVRVVERESTVAFPDVVETYNLQVSIGEAVLAVDASATTDAAGSVTVTTSNGTYHAHGCIIAERTPTAHWAPTGIDVDGDRIVVNEVPATSTGTDVLVVGTTDGAVELCSRLAAAGSNVVLAADGIDPRLLSPVAEQELQRLERARRVTVLYRANPQQITFLDGDPMVSFGDRRTPDLQFDHVVFAPPRRNVAPSAIGLTAAGARSERIWFADAATLDEIAAAFPGIRIAAQPSHADRRRGFAGAIEELRAEHYNATITHFEPTHSDLWVLRVRPDDGNVTHLPGQYASLGLGYWEARIDDAEDPALDDKWNKLIRRSYSISSRMFDAHGYLTGDLDNDELEFYIVLVPPTGDNVPGLTPRLALKRPGDRIYLGPKVAGRYTLKPVVNPDDTVLFFATGTGEAPHNAMIVELLRKRHRGPMISAVSVRKWADLGYLEQHRELARTHPNYTYLPMPTREADIPKKYLQDLIRDNTLVEHHRVTLDPATTHLFLCGNPAMIGLPETVDGISTYPAQTGVVELMVERGFTLDHGSVPGNIHFEEYW